MPTYFIGVGGVERIHSLDQKTKQLTQYSITDPNFIGYNYRWVQVGVSIYILGGYQKPN